MLEAALNRNLIQVRNARKVQSARRLEDYRLAVVAPAHRRVIGGMEGKLLGGAAFSRNDKHVIVAVAVGGKGNPFSVRGKSWINVTRFMHGNALYIGSVFIRDPYVAKITESNFSIVITGMTQQLHFRQRECAEQKQQGDKNSLHRQPPENRDADSSFTGNCFRWKGSRRHEVYAGWALVASSFTILYGWQSKTFFNTARQSRNQRQNPQHRVKE